jgi:hypothetical protein
MCDGWPAGPVPSGYYRGACTGATTLPLLGARSPSRLVIALRSPLPGLRILGGERGTQLANLHRKALRRAARCGIFL